jgi:uncharacterized membrane protein
MNNLNIFLVVLVVSAGVLGVIFCSTSFATVGNDLRRGNEFINKGLDISLIPLLKSISENPEN